MPAQAPSAERPMTSAPALWQRGGMDEPTIDCVVCHQAGAYEAARYVLNDAAEWVCEERGVLCEGHLYTIELALRGLQHWQRIIVMRL